MKKTLLMIGRFSLNRKNYKSPNKDLALALGKQGWAVHQVSHHSFSLFFLLDVVWNLLRKRSDYNLAQIDVYSGRAFLWAEISKALLMFLKKPFVLTLHGGNLPKFSESRKERVEKFFKEAVFVTAPSAYLAKEMEPYYPNIKIIPNGIDLQRFPFRFRNSFRPRLVWVRAFHTLYNPMLAPKVLGELLKEYPEATLQMVGPDKGDGSLEKTRELACHLGIQKSLRIHTGVPSDDIPKYLDGADVFLNTTDFDNAPLSLLEAMASGLCVITTNVGGIPAWVDHEKEALLVSPNRADEMAQAVKRVLKNQQFAAMLAQAARAKAESRDWSKIIRTWDELLMQPLEAHK